MLGTFLVIFILGSLVCSQVPTLEAAQQTQLEHPKQNPQGVIAEMQVLCNSDSILLKMNTNAPFNGMVYAKEAPTANCVSEFNSATNMTFKLPLKSCGTLFSEVDDGIEYFNTVVVQPHMRLMTNQGKGYHIRCKYQTRERTIANTQFNVSASFHMQDAPKTTTPLLATASMPSCTMKIFRKGRSDIAESVKIGDKLVMVIEIDRQEMYGMRISNCVVRDGLNVAEQLLIDNMGCPLDDVIMPAFEYSNNYTRAAVSFPAHKFPHTSSVYYQCNISLCINNGNCAQNECKPGPGPQGNVAQGQAAPSQTGARRKRHSTHSTTSRMTNSDTLTQRTQITDLDENPSSEDLTFEVYSGLQVNDADPDVDLEPGLEKEESRVTKGGIDESFSLDQLKSFGQSGLALCLLCLAALVMLIVLVCQLALPIPKRHARQMNPVHLTHSKQTDRTLGSFSVDYDAKSLTPL